MIFRLPKKVIEKKFAIISTSSYPFTREKNKEFFISAEEFIKNKGININFMENRNKKHHKSAGTIKEKIDDIKDGLNGNYEIILNSIGGYNCVSLLNKELLSAFGKKNIWISWMSDPTVLLNAITYSTGLITLYGIDYIWWFWKFLRANYYQSFIDIICQHNIKTLNQYKFELIKWWSSENFSGRIMWWCLSSFVLLLWTEFDPLDKIDENFILVIEDFWKKPSEIQDYCYQLKNSIWFKKFCRWIIIGSLLKCVDEDYPEISVLELIKEAFEWFNITLLKSNEIWHWVSNIPLLIWAKFELNNNDMLWNWSI